MKKKVGKINQVILNYVYIFFIEVVKNLIILMNLLQISMRLICFFLVASNLSASESSIVLRMQDMNHKPISQAMCKAPFILQIELKNLEGYTDIHLMQYFSGIENFKCSRSMNSRNVSIDNGKKTTKSFYNFVLRSDKKGVFSIGNLSLKDKLGDHIESNILTIPVGDEVVLSEKEQKAKYFMTMSVDKKQAYIGEKITLSIKFFDRLFVDDLHLQFPNYENAYFIKNKKHFHKSSVVFENEEYSVTEWIFDVYGIESGPLMFQNIYAAFFAPELESKFNLGGAFDFFRSLHKSEQRVVANPVAVEIVPLPESEDFHDVSAVGQFSNFIISINQNSVPVGQGVVLTIELFGDANFEMMKSPSLILPKNFKYYDSNMITLDEERTCKRCEFIVQADTIGNYCIEPQVFAYFDPVDLKYKTLQSKSIDIEITPAIQTSIANIISHEELNDLDNHITKEVKDFIIIKQGVAHEQPQIIIPLNTFQRLIYLLFFIWFFLAIYRYVIQKHVFKLPWLINFIIFYQARKACIHALSKKEVNCIYPIFIELFSHLIGINSGKLYKSIIIQYLVDKGFSTEQIKAWTVFYEQILQVSFSSQSQIVKQDLFLQALQWIQQLKDKS